ncbi:MAG: GspH/FimT family pseudopilin [Legionellaceae bacterium]|nr:GspH/FimT family pseudopilin [Legionellaceae bacterium]
MISRNRGYTLIEILVVIVIVGILARMSLSVWGDFGKSRQIKAESQRLLQYIRYLRHRAVLTSETLGIRLNPHGYSTYHYQQKWLAIPSSSLLKKQTFPSSIFIRTVTKKTSSKTLQPDIIIYPSGETSQFNIILGTAQHPDIAHLKDRDIQ